MRNSNDGNMEETKNEHRENLIDIIMIIVVLSYVNIIYDNLIKSNTTKTK